MILTILCLILLPYVGLNIYIYIIRGRYKHLNSINIPLSPIWFLGAIPDIRRRTTKRQGMTGLDVFIEYHEETGWDVFHVAIYKANIVVCWNLEMIAKVLPDRTKFKKSANFNKTFANVGGVRIFGMHGLLNDPGTELWKAKRRTMDPAFHKSFLRTIMYGMNRVTTNLMDRLNNEIGKDAFDITDYFNRSAMEAISICGFDWDEELITAHGVQTVHMANTLLATMTVYLSAGTRLLFSLPWYKKKEKLQLKEAVVPIRNILRSHLRQRLDNKDMQKEDILSYIIKSNQCSDLLTLEDLVDEYLVFTMAGMETTAIVMAMTVFYLSTHPDVYERVQQEIDEVYGDNEDLNFDELNKLVYLEQIMKETLRLKPPARSTGREVVSDNVVLEGTLIPKGAIVSIPSYALQRDPRYWDNPLEFDPDRFSPRSNKVTSYTYMPFAAGPRNCIGKNFAMLEIKVVISRLLREFVLVNPKPKVKDIPTHGVITARPIGGVHIKIIPRVGQ